MKKFTRGSIRSFVKRFATDGDVLEIGVASNDYDAAFPHRMTLDIDPARTPDVVADIVHMPFPDNRFDTIICSEVFEHLPDPDEAEKELRRVMKPGGRLILTTRFAFPIHDAPGDFLRYTPYMLRRLFSDWEIETLEYEADPFSTVAILLQRIIFQTELRGGKISKAAVYGLALLIRALRPLIKKQYGDIAKNQPVENMLFSGIYMACKKVRVQQV
jgi:SAM-dependent methyltransferase